MLAVLVAHSGHLVVKDEILRTVWADPFVEEATIAGIIHTLRRTLGEDEKGKKFIETVATKGYRIVSKVTEDNESMKQQAERDSRAYSAYEDFPDTIHLDESAKANVRSYSNTEPVAQQNPRHYVHFTLGFATSIFSFVART